MTRKDVPFSNTDPFRFCPADGTPLGDPRPVREELGVEVEVEERPVLLATHTYGPDGIWVLAISFRARLVDGEPSPADDVAGIRWVSAEDIDDLDFAWEHDRNLVRAALENEG